MYKAILTRMRQGRRTTTYPAGAPPSLPPMFRGLPRIDSGRCVALCRSCSEACPARAIDPETKALDLGRCILCAECALACPAGAISFSADYRLSARRREDLVLAAGQEGIRLAEALEKRMLRLFGRSLKLRQVSAGGCNACEADVNVLGTIGWDMGRFGIQFVASPRHADGLLVTGPVTANMELALRKTYDAVPEPKLVIAVGACAISGGVYADSPESRGGAPSALPVDLFIPGCPPHPLTTLDGLLRLLGRI